jgi:hypothetical protein
MTLGMIKSMYSTQGLSKPFRCKIGVLEWGVRKG